MMTTTERKAETSDLNTLKVIDGTTYIGVAVAITVGPDEYETQVRWHVATRKDIRKAQR